MFSNIIGQTPLDDLSGLIPEYITTKDELNNAENTNIISAKKKYILKPTFNYTLSFFYKVHFDMFFNVWDWAGKKRLTNLNIGLNFQEIDIELKKLIDDLLCWEENSFKIIEIASYFHHRLIKIHPFLNGNGRWSRFITNLYLHKNEGFTINWPEQNFIKKTNFRENYLKALKKADKLNYDDFIQMHKKLYDKH